MPGVPGWGVSILRNTRPVLCCGWRVLAGGLVAFALSGAATACTGDDTSPKPRPLVLPSGIDVSDLYPSYLDRPPGIHPRPHRLPHGRLQVFTDGCGVIRTGFHGQPPDGLGWSVLDSDGFEVLQRNALGETRYRYYRSGTYTVVLVAWDGIKYAPVSNRVTIHC